MGIRNTNSMMSVAFIVALCVIIVPLAIAALAKLAGVEFQGAISFLNNDGIWILMLPVSGLFTIFRHGRWTGWKVVEWSSLLSAFIWFGWAVGLVLGVFALFAGR